MFQKKIKFSLRLFIILQIFVFAGFGQKPPVKKQDAKVSAQLNIEIRIYLTNPTLPERKDTCSAGEFVSRKILKTKKVEDAALRLVFIGPTAKESAKGMQSISPLGKYCIGVSIKDKTAIVNFRRGAENICMSTVHFANDKFG